MHLRNYEHAKALGRWPLRTGYVNGKRDNGFTITAYTNASDFIEEQENGDYDWTRFMVITFDSDISFAPHTKGVPEMFGLPYFISF